MGNDLVIIRRKHGRIWKFRKEKVNWRGKREKESSSCSSLTNPLFIPPSLSWRFQKYLLAITPGVFKGQSRKEEQEEERGIRVHNVDKIYCHATRLRDSGPRNTSNAPLTRKKLSWQFFTFFRVMHSYCISNSIESRIPIFVASFSSTFFFLHFIFPVYAPIRFFHQLKRNLASRSHLSIFRSKSSEYQIGSKHWKQFDDSKIKLNLFINYIYIKKKIE